MRATILLILSVILALSLMASCASHKSSSSPSAGRAGSAVTGSPADAYSEKSLDSGKSSVKTSADSAFLISSSAVDLQKEAASKGTTPGKLALAIIINKLDNATVVDDLCKKNAQELFDILRQTANQKSQTLEGLNSMFRLRDILASEGIYVNIQANNITSTAPFSPSGDWVAFFEKALAGGE